MIYIIYIMSSNALGKVLLEYRSLEIINYTADYNIPSIHLILGEGPCICYWSLVYKNNLLALTWFGMPVPTSSNIWLDVHSRCARSCKQRGDEWGQEDWEPTGLSVHRTKLSSPACTASHGFSISTGFIPPPGLYPTLQQEYGLLSSAHAHKSWVETLGFLSSFFGSPFCYPHIHPLGITSVHMSVLV